MTSSLGSTGSARAAPLATSTRKVGGEATVASRAGAAATVASRAGAAAPSAPSSGRSRSRPATDRPPLRTLTRRSVRIGSAPPPCRAAWIDPTAPPGARVPPGRRAAGLRDGGEGALPAGYEARETEVASRSVRLARAGLGEPATGEVIQLDAA